MKENKRAFVFPAFITEYTGKEIEFLTTNSIDINTYLQRVANVLNQELPAFSYGSEFYRDELNAQLLAYTMSCAMNDALNQKGIFPDFIAGYSMGIYASLYAARSITFEQGAKIIHKAYNIVEELSRSLEYGMGAVIGLSYNDTEKLIKDKSIEVEIININNEHSLVIAGLRKDVKLLLELAREEGALTAAELTVKTPYHSKFLVKYSDPFAEFLKDNDVQHTDYPLISTYDQRMIKSSDEIRPELVYNLTQKINWYKTMQQLIDMGVEEMYECGAGKDLKKISRFIDGDYALISVYKV